MTLMIWVVVCVLAVSLVLVVGLAWTMRDYVRLRYGWADRRRGERRKRDVPVDHDRRGSERRAGT